MKLVIVSVAACLCVKVCMAATIHVPSEQPTIQAGIDAAIDGDTVLVAPGTYTGDGNRDIDFGGRNVVVKSEAGSESTIIDCECAYEDLHTGFSLISGEDTTATVEGFTITGFTFGAIECRNSSPTIKYNLIEDNTSWFGGGIGCYASGAIIRGNTFVQNMSSSSGIIGGGQGGAIRCLDSDPCIDSNIIAQNGASHEYAGGYGGGIFCWNGAPVITRNIIINNAAGPGDMGAGGMGGGIYLFNSAAFISNNTIVGNWAAWYPPYWFSTGGGIYSYSSDATIKNCIIAYNNGGGLYVEGSAPSEVVCNDSYENTCCDWNGYIGINGNFAADPLFCDSAAGNFNVNAESPCLPANNECGILIGAVGAGCGELCGDANTSYGVDIDDIVYLIYFLFAGGPAPDIIELADSDCSGVVDLNDAIHLLNYIFAMSLLPCDTDGDELPDC